jgi:integrase
MGTITRRTDNAGKATYQAKIRRKGFPALSQTFPDRLSAETWVQETEAGMTRGTFVDPRPARDTTLGQLLNRYAEEVSPAKRGHEVEKIRLAFLGRQAIAKARVADLSAGMVREYRDARLKTVAASTVNREMNLLGHVIETARKEWAVPFQVNPVQEVRRPKNPPARDRRLRPGEEERLLSACSAARGGFLPACVVLAIETGMRQGEIVGLQWKDVDLERRVARLHEGATKNGHGRGVPLSSRAVAVLQERGPASGRVFDGVTPGAIKQAFAKAATRAGMPDLHFHDLRHEAVSRLFERGFNVMEAAAVSGHRDLTMLRRYAHLEASALASRLG